MIYINYFMDIIILSSGFMFALLSHNYIDNFIKKYFNKDINDTNIHYEFNELYSSYIHNKEQIRNKIEKLYKYYKDNIIKIQNIEFDIIYLKKEFDIIKKEINNLKPLLTKEFIEYNKYNREIFEIKDRISILEKNI